VIRLGEAQVADQALESIVRLAVESVPGARLDTPGRVSRVLPGRRGPVEWTLTGRVAAFDVDVVCEHGRVLPGLGEQVRAAVAEHVGGMTGLSVRAVDVTVTGLDRPREPAR
jgi:uncharacterized alkaline shock family protein YloU